MRQLDRKEHSSRTGNTCLPALQEKRLLCQKGCAALQAFHPPNDRLRMSDLEVQSETLVRLVEVNFTKIWKFHITLTIQNTGNFHSLLADPENTLDLQF
jgi:hypothetical protein